MMLLQEGLKKQTRNLWLGNATTLIKQEYHLTEAQSEDVTTIIRTA